VSKPAILVTAADLAPQALEILKDFDVKFLGKTPSEEDVFNACTDHQPVAIIVRYSTISRARWRRAERCAWSPSTAPAPTRSTSRPPPSSASRCGLPAGANADAVAEHSWALILGIARAS
jgi:D-3-phosphoglycerate dehydrogenase